MQGWLDIFARRLYNSSDLRKYFDVRITYLMSQSHVEWPFHRSSNSMLNKTKRTNLTKESLTLWNHHSFPLFSQ